MINTDTLRLQAKILRLGTIAANCESLIHNAQVDTPTYLDFLSNVFAGEIEQRQINDEQRRMKSAKLPIDIDLDKFDFNYSAGITKPQLSQLRELVWLEQSFNIVLVGPSGTGKTFITAGLVRDAVKSGYRAYFNTMEDIVNIIRMKNMTSKALSVYNRLLKAHLVAIDDIMLMPIKHDEATGFFNLINALHQKSSIIITTNKTPVEWAQTLEDEVLASALLDRLLYKCQVIKLSGVSYRMENRKSIFEQ